MAKQAKCDRCNVRVVWEKERILKHLYCPECGEKLKQTSKMSTRPVINIEADLTKQERKLLSMKSKKTTPKKTKKKEKATVTKPVKQKITKTKADVKQKAPSKMDLLRAQFKRKKHVHLEVLMDVTGWDNHVVHSAMHLLRNTARTKSPEKQLITTYDRHSRFYTKI